MKFELNKTTALIAIIAMLILVTLVLYNRLQSVAKRSNQRGMDTEISSDIEATLLRTGETGTTVFKQVESPDYSTTNYREINLYDFVKILKSDPASEGFYIYPIIYSMDNSKIDYVLAIDQIKSSLHTYTYYRLSSNHPSPGTLGAALIDKEDAMGLFKKYHNNIKSIEHASYIGHSLRPSRFYTVGEFYSFLRRMGIKPLADDINDLKDYIVVIKGAAINTELAKEIDLYFKDEIPVGYDYRVHVGFTAYLTIKREGARMGMAFEIGKPCPPRCGELDWNSTK